MVYKGKGPRFYYVGTVRRISHDARIEWQRSMEAASDDGARYEPHRPTPTQSKAQRPALVRI